MASEAYWERRKAVLMFDEMEKAEAGANEIVDIFARGSVWLASQMDRIFEKYRDKFGLTEEEARDLMSQMQDPSDIDELLSMLRRRQDSMARQELLKKLEASAYRYRINRLKHLQDDIVRLMSQIARQQQVIVKDTLQTIGRDSFYHEIFDLQQRTGVAFPFNKVNTKLIDQVMRSKWSGENYSSRIWSNTDELAKILKEELLLSMATGRSERDAARVISEKMQSGSMQARRLIRTESNYIYTEMDMRAYEEAGIEEYIFIAILDLRTSKICRKLDGQIFKVKDHKSGKNCPPMHPWCRSTTGGVISRELLKKMTRIARDPVTGKSIHVPMTMNYQEWYEKYVEGTGADKKKAEPGSRNLTREQFERYRERGIGPETYDEFLKAKADPETWKRMQRDFKDTKEYSRFREIIGDDIPETFEQYQRIKYNEPENWERIKNNVRYANSVLTQTGGHHYKPEEFDTEQDIKAIEAYEKYRREYDADRIAESSGFTVREVEQVKRHIFYCKHKLYESYDFLKPDYDMAVAWKRLREGNPLPRDIFLLHHELTESKIEKKENITLYEAHRKASEKYDWAALLEKETKGGEPFGLL